MNAIYTKDVVGDGSCGYYALAESLAVSLFSDSDFFKSNNIDIANNLECFKNIIVKTYTDTKLPDDLNEFLSSNQINNSPNRRKIIATEPLSINEVMSKLKSLGSQPSSFVIGKAIHAWLVYLHINPSRVKFLKCNKSNINEKVFIAQNICKLHGWEYKEDFNNEKEKIDLVNKCISNLDTLEIFNSDDNITNKESITDNFITHANTCFDKKIWAEANMLLVACNSLGLELNQFNVLRDLTHDVESQKDEMVSHALTLIASNSEKQDVDLINLIKNELGYYMNIDSGIVKLSDKIPLTDLSNNYQSNNFIESHSSHFANIVLQSEQQGMLAGGYISGTHFTPLYNQDQYTAFYNIFSREKNSCKKITPLSIDEIIAKARNLYYSYQGSHTTSQHSQTSTFTNSSIFKVVSTLLKNFLETAVKWLKAFCYTLYFWGLFCTKILPVVKTHQTTVSKDVSSKKQTSESLFKRIVTTYLYKKDSTDNKDGITNYAKKTR